MLSLDLARLQNRVAVVHKRPFEEDCDRLSTVTQWRSV